MRAPPIPGASAAAALAALLLLTSLPSPGQEAAQAPPAGGRKELAERLVAEVERFHEAGSFEGAVLVALDGEVVARHAVGSLDRRSGAMNTPETVFAAGSLGKQFTAAAVLKLAEQGLLRLDDPLSKHLPDYPRERLERGGVAVTLDHLLHHTAGLPDIDGAVEIARPRWHRPVPFSAEIAAAGRRPLRSVPGHHFHYSNLGYNLLGEVARRASGGTLDAFLQKHLLDPLGMEHTGFAAREPERLARGSFRLLDRRLDSASSFGLVAPPLGEDHASGGLRTTVDDLYLWTRLYEGRGPLGQPWVDVMLRPGLERYGCGVVSVDVNGWKGFWHNGALSPLGFTSELSYFPERRAAVVVLANVDLIEGAATARLRTNLVHLLQNPAASPPRSAHNPLPYALLAAPLGAFFFVALGPLRRLFLVAALLVQSYHLAHPRQSRLQALASLVNAWSFCALLLLLADLSVVVRWAGLSAVSVAAALGAQAALGLPWLHTGRSRHALTLLAAAAALAITAYLAGLYLLPPLLLVLGLVAFGLRRARGRAAGGTS